MDGSQSEQQHQGLLAPSAEYLSQVKVFPLIPYLKKDVLKNIDSALSWEQLTASDINFAIVRPLVYKYSKLNNMAIVYGCLVVRSYFLSEAEEDLTYAGIMRARASLCEILAMKLLPFFTSNHMELVAVLTTSWSPLAGAPDGIVDEVKLALRVDGDDIDAVNYPQSALEMAIGTQAKTFMSGPIVQKVVNDIYSGHIIFSSASTRSIMADNYKPRPIEIYDSRNNPLLDHYRLRVPRYGAILEFVNFALLLSTFVLCLSQHDDNKLTMWEIIFIIFGAAFTLEEYTASVEHGWTIYTANMWNMFDVSFIAMFLAYVALRIKGLIENDPLTSEMGFDILACGACILFPRLAFFAVSNNTVILSLRAMISQFIYFIGIAAVCFSGICFTLWSLAAGTWTLRGIIWLMVQIWFGNTYLSFAQATSFHPVFGPILMTAFAALSNTLLLTILISILSNTAAKIDANANQEYLFQFAITTIEGVKSDALFSYQPPMNILAFLILKPASWVVTPRALHSLNVFLIKFTSWPILLVIGLYERYLRSGMAFRESGVGAAQSLYQTLPKNIRSMPILSALAGSSSDDFYDAIFDVEVSYEFDLFAESDQDHHPNGLRNAPSRESMGHGGPGASRSRSFHAVSPSPGPAQPAGSPIRARKVSHLSPLMEPDSSNPTESPIAAGLRSPLARLFGRQLPQEQPTNLESTVNRVEEIIIDLKDLPVSQLKGDMKELQDRQARIENLLLMLTHGMRNDNDSGPTPLT